MSAENQPDEQVPNDDHKFSKSGDLTADGGVIKQIITHGTGFQMPQNGDDIKMHYRGTLLDGTQFDSSYDRSTPFVFKLGDGKVIKGWDIVGKTMRKGEKAHVTLKPEYAYGANGSPPKIGENATLVFEMELISWASKRDVFGDGLVTKTEIKPGDGWERPGTIAEITLAVVATSMTADGKELKLLHDAEQTFTCGSSQVPEAWEKVAVDMKKGSVISLLCRPPHIAGPSVHYVPPGTEAVRYDLTLLSWRKIEDIYDDSKLLKKVLEEGEGWERPNEGSDVVISTKYSISCPTSKLMVPPPAGDPYHVEESQHFKVGDGIVTDGLDRVVQSMKLNESALVLLAPEHAYETAPSLLLPEYAKKGVSVSSSILIEIKLEKFDKAKDVWSMSFEEKVEEMQVRKKCGNELFKEGRYATAKKSYDRAVAFFDSPTSELSPELKSKVNELLVQCHLNLAMCLDRLGDIQKVMAHCKKVLEISPSNVKALYRQGCAYLTLEDYYNANSCLKYALELSPGNVDVRRKLKELKTKRVKQDQEDKKRYSNLFGRMDKLEQKEKLTTHTNGHSTDSLPEVDDLPMQAATPITEQGDQGTKL